MFSPDGHWLAYASNASGRQEIYVRPYPIVQGTERRVSEGGGAGPVWAPDGSALYYRGAKSLMVASTPLGPGFVPGRPRALFSTERFRFSGNASAFDIHPDGKRFVMVTMGDPPPPLPRSNQCRAQLVRGVEAPRASRAMSHPAEPACGAVLSATPP